MPIDLPDDYWIDIPACTYTLGVTPDEARRYAEEAAAFKNAQPLPEMDAWDEIEEREQRSANVDYLAEAALRSGPCRVVTIPAYAIARYPVTNALFARFLEETQRTADDGALQRGRTHPDEAVEQRSWDEVQAFMAWSGYRVPFDDEWERAARGPQRSLFPWGNNFGDVGRSLVASAVERLSQGAARRAATAEGFVAYAGRGWEWCADLWSDELAVLEDPWARTRSRWSRVLRGGLDYWEAAPITLHGIGLVEAEPGDGDFFRLVKHNGRAVPVAPPMTGWSRAREKVRAFERTVARPALETVADELEFHRTSLWNDDTPPPLGGIPSYLARSLEKTHGHYVRRISEAYLEPPEHLASGIYLGAVTLETIRRVITPNHGIFLWNILYRLDANERILAHPVAFYHMACDRQWHRFDDRFRPGEDDTPISEITPQMIIDHVREAFRLYDEYADADHPRPSGRRETRTPALRTFRAR